MKLNEIMRKHGILIVGLALPVLLMIIFLGYSLWTQYLNEPPKFDMLFAVADSSLQTEFAPTLFVKDGTLNVRYTSTRIKNNLWKNLYIFRAKTQKVDSLVFSPPQNNANLKDSSYIVEATKNLKIDTNKVSPDGYQLSYVGNNRNGLLEFIFWPGNSYQMCLKKGSKIVRLVSNDERVNFFPYYLQFLGWVINE